MKQALQVVTRHFGSLVLLALSGVAVGADNCDPENGKKVYQICSVCHSNDTTGVHAQRRPIYTVWRAGKSARCRVSNFLQRYVILGTLGPRSI